jgi:hypothetical protein
MTELISRLDDWSDRLSPIVVKEIRQMVRGREFSYSFGLSLVAGLLVAFFGLADALTSAGNSGPRVFSALMVCLGLLGLGVVPIGTFSALRSERADQTLDLMTQTALSPRSIVVGKLMTQWIKLLTLFAGLSPFITMSFLLGGIDLQTILISLAVLFMWSMWVCAACLFLSSASQSRAMSAAVFIGLGLVVIFVLGSAARMVMMIVFGGAPTGGLLGISQVGWTLAASTALCFVSMTNLVLLAENRLSLAIEDRSTALRIGFFVQFLLILTCIAGPLMAKATGYTVPDAIGALGVLGGIHLSITAIFAITEDMGLSRRVFRRVQKSLGKPWLAIFRPGGGRGAGWILTQMGVLLAVGLYLSTDRQQFRWLLAICGYICFFTGVPTVIFRRMFNSRIRTAYVRAGILLFFPIVGVSADVFQYFIMPSRIFDFSAYHVLNPFRALALDNWKQIENQGWVFGPVLMGLAGLIAYLELYRMGRREDKNAANSL